MKKFTLLENFKYSDEEIEDFFLDYVDNKKFELHHGFINKDKQFFTRAGDVMNGDRECKKVTIILDGKATGIQNDYGGARAVTDISIISKILASIKTFYDRSYEDINFIIDTKYDDIEVTFFIVGNLVDKSQVSLYNRELK